MSGQLHGPRRGSAADVARTAIEQAERDGVDRERMILRLTLRDTVELKRDRHLPLADISFGQAGMRFLGVRVEQGGVTVSTLDRGGEAVAEPLDPPVVVKPAKPRRTKVAP